MNPAAVSREELRSIDRRNPATSATDRRRAGRPSRQEAEQLRDRILDVATPLFLEQGYGATSIELVAKRARISKRTFYRRFRDKSALFGAVIHRLVAQLRPSEWTHLFEGESLEAILQRLAEAILRSALKPESLALLRIILAEATRFPELAAVVNEQGGRQDAISNIAHVLERKGRAGGFYVCAPLFAAEQFVQLVVSAPQRRALGLGAPLTDAELEAWTRDSVRLFLYGIRARVSATSPPAPPHQ
jgi:AcrR family transcriptional regulator